MVESLQRKTAKPPQSGKKGKFWRTGTSLKGKKNIPPNQSKASIEKQWEKHYGLLPGQAGKRGEEDIMEEEKKRKGKAEDIIIGGLTEDDQNRTTKGGNGKLRPESGEKKLNH